MKANRRNFIRQSLTAAAGIISTAPLSASDHVVHQKPTIISTSNSKNLAPIKFSVIGLNHGHIYGQCEAVIRNGGQLVSFYAKEPELTAAFTKRYPDAKLARSEKEILEERIKYAKVWIENYAPHEFKNEFKDEVPKEVSELSNQQKDYLILIKSLFEKEKNADELQVALYNAAKETGIQTKDAFSAIYISFIGKLHGPKAGLLLTNLGKEKVLARIEEVTK